MNQLARLVCTCALLMSFAGAKGECLSQTGVKPCPPTSDARVKPTNADPGQGASGGTRKLSQSGISDSLGGGADATTIAPSSGPSPDLTKTPARVPTPTGYKDM